MRRLIEIILLIPLCLALCAEANAQSVRGYVLDENDSAMEFATIALISLPDSTVCGSGMTDGNVGKLNINFNADFVSGRGSSDTETIESSLISPAEISANSKYKGTGAGQDAKSRMSN